jgi:hypothetical protein
MFICGRVADARDRPFFAQQATKILMVRKVENKTSILVAAEGFLWPERLVDLGSGSGSNSGFSPSDETLGKIGD